MQLELTQISKNYMPSIQNDCQAKKSREQLELQCKSHCKLPLNYMGSLHNTISGSC